MDQKSVDERLVRRVRAPLMFPDYIFSA